MHDIKTQLETGKDRFLSTNLSYALETGWIRHEDLIEMFPPERLMGALEQAPLLRTRLLVEVLGVHEKVAPKKSTAAAAEDLTIALAEKVITPETVFRVVDADEHIRYLPPTAIWALLCRSEFWKKDDTRSRERMLFTLQRAEQEGLLTKTRLFELLGLGRIAQDLPKPALEKALVRALERGMAGAPLSPVSFEDAIPLAELLTYIKLSHVWETVVIGQIAVAAGLVPPVARRSSAPPAPLPEAIPSSILESDIDPVTTTALEPLPPAPEISRGTAEEARVLDEAEEAARAKALENLRRIGRQPARPETLSTPVLLGLDSMCAELRTLDDDEDREACIRDAFPNQALLFEALVALAEILDPRLDRAKLTGHGDIDTLVQVILFEERRIARSKSTPGPELENAVKVPSDIRGLVPPPPPGAHRSVAPSLPPLPGSGGRSLPPPVRRGGR
jgi:hypothetical protein